MTVLTDVPKSLAIFDNDLDDFLDVLRTSRERSLNSFCLEVRVRHDFLYTGILFLFTKSCPPSPIRNENRHKFA